MKLILMIMLLCSSVVYAAPNLSVVPRPVEFKVQRGAFEIKDGTVITVDTRFSDSNLRNYLEQALVPATGFTFRKSDWDQKGIVFKKIDADPMLGSEGYRMRVTPDLILIESPTETGAFYGIQTLLQMLPAAIFSKQKQTGTIWIVPSVEIVDYPRFQWRGLMIDVSRHFMGAEYIKRFIDLLALHKMNTFHWHLCDDDGWRIEIRKYPKLTGQGSSGSRTIDYGKPTFYTQEEIKDIVRYAAERHVTIVPEIEIPGHQKAAIAAYPEWGAADDNGRLGNVFNLRDETINALKDILSEVVDLFPGKFVHCGGDEVWGAWAWKKDPVSEVKAQQLGLKDPHQIQTWIMNEMGTFLASKHRRMVGWGEIAGDKLSKDTVVMAWRGTGKTGIASAKKGFDVVMAPGVYTYFDHKQAPNEKGWGNQIVTVEKVYSFNPAVPGELTSAESQHILGVQGQLWTEAISTEARMDYMAYPRGSALAEVGWTPQTEREYKDFQKRMGFHLKRLEILGVKYRVPEGLLIERDDGKIIIYSAMDNGIIHYTIDGSDPDSSSPVYRGPVPTRGIPLLKARLVTASGRLGPIVSCVGVRPPPLLPENCEISGGMRVENLKPNQKSIGKWGNSKGTLTWKTYISRAGTYLISGEFSCTDPAEMKLTVDDKEILFTIPKLKGWNDPMKVEIGSITIAEDAGTHKVVLSVSNPEGYKGINMWRIDWVLKSNDY